MMIWAGLVILAAAGLLGARLAPTEPARWHQPIAATTDADFSGGALRVVPAEAQDLARIDAAARALPRTRVIAGSVEEGRITYLTRSRVFGFPDFTTVEYAQGTLKIYARLRFGQSDFGVNLARVHTLLGALGTGG